MKTQIMSRTHGRVESDAAKDGIQAVDASAGAEPIGELVEILRDELAAHHKLIQLEMSKQEAIIARDGERLKHDAGEQVKELHHIDLLESRRDRIAQKILQTDNDVRLSQIIESDAVAAPEKRELGRYQVALKSALAELKHVSELNARMLIDSRDLFKTMLSSLSGRHPHHEGAPPRPVLVDANC